jgi:hypothetical protein
VVSTIHYPELNKFSAIFAKDDKRIVNEKDCEINNMDEDFLFKYCNHNATKDNFLENLKKMY